MSAGIFDFPAALQLVRLRGSLMESAYPEGYGMGAILGLNEAQVAGVLAPINTPRTPVFLANLNAPRQIVIAGSDEGLTLALNQARLAGASKTGRLKVMVPSHCRLMTSVAEQLTKAIKQVPLHPPRIPYISNRGARTLRTQEAIAEDLATCIAYPVRWHDVTTVLFERGARLFVELPPGHVLASLASEAFPEARAVAVADCQLHSVVVLTQREQR
jgi:malonate decarboxylase epsilon subunit